MPITYRFTRNIVEVVFVGDNPRAEIEAISHRILSDPAFNPGMNLLIDARQTTANPSLAEIRSRAVFIRTTFAGNIGRIAMVVASNLHFGLGRMLSTYTRIEGLDFEVFIEMEEAIGYLEST